MSDVAAMISHSSKDGDEAMQLCKFLEATGLHCWIAPRDLAPGEEWSDGIMRGIETAATMVLIVSQHINTSPHILSEITQAVHLGKKIFPVLIGEVRLSRSLDYYLRPRHWLFANSGSSEHVAGLLARAIRGTSDWREETTRPSIMRRLRYGSLDGVAAVFVGSLAALMVVAGSGWLLWRAQQAEQHAAANASYLSLGWIVPSYAVRTAGTERDRSADWQVFGSVFLGGPNPGFADVELVLVPYPRPADARVLDVSDQIDQRHVGSAQTFKVQVPALTDRVVVCLGRRHPVLGTPHRVEQVFDVHSNAIGEGKSRVQFTPTSDPKVVAARSSACGQ